jgi:Flagellin and related hook-associated proteins
MINLSTGAFFERATRQIGSLRERANELQDQIGSGERLSRSSDDPVAAARLRSLARRERLSEVDERNAERAMGDLQLTDKALGSFVDIVIRARELAMQAANETLGEDQRQLLRAEIDGLRESVLLVANSRNGAGQALFGGQTAGLAYEDTGAGITYIGTETAESVGIGDGQSVTRALTGPEVLTFDFDGAPTDLFAVLATLSAALQDPLVDASDAGRLAMSQLDAGLDRITTAQTIVGARMGWIEIIDQRRLAASELIAEERSEIGGADLATTMTRLQEVLTVLEASQASFVRLASLSLFNSLR